MFGDVRSFLFKCTYITAGNAITVFDCAFLVFKFLRLVVCCEVLLGYFDFTVSSGIHHSC